MKPLIFNLKKIFVFFILITSAIQTAEKIDCEVNFVYEVQHIPDSSYAVESENSIGIDIRVQGGDSH